MIVGDKVVCINNINKGQYTINKIYTITEFIHKYNGVVVKVSNDYDSGETVFRYSFSLNENPEHYYMFQDYFTELRKIRKEKLEKLKINEKW